MFAAFLYPFPVRGLPAPYLWVCYKLLGDLGAEHVAVIASADYFRSPIELKAQGRFDCHAPINPELGFEVPTEAKLATLERAHIPTSIYRRLKAWLPCDEQVWRFLITQVDDELVDVICHKVTTISAGRACEGLITWCNFASLREAARRLGLPVLHCELGPLRRPRLRGLGYLDFRGVNGCTEAQARQENAPDLPQHFRDLDELRRFFGLPAADEHPAPDAALGVPLQVEDDSNVLAYGRGFDMNLLLRYAEEAFAQNDILIRPHPGARFLPKPTRRIDTSTTSTEFVLRCERILSLNSSVAVEALLLGRPVTMLGESPASHIAGRSVAEPRRATQRELEFLLLNYFVPYELVFDLDYFRWRLTGPSEAAIRRRHLEHWESSPATIA